MATTKNPPKKGHAAGEALDGVNWVLRQVALPIPDFLFYRKQKVVKGKK